MKTENLDGRPLSAIKPGLQATELMELISGAPFLEGLTPEQVADVAAACELVQIEGDEQLLTRDMPNDSLYMVLYGGLRAVAQDMYGHRRVILEAYRGDIVGMIGLVCRDNAPADVFAIRDSVLLRLTRARFTVLAARYPTLVMRLAEALVSRALALIGRQTQWTTWTRPGAAVQNIALLLPSRDIDFARSAADQAFVALAHYRRVGRITAARVDAALGAGASSGAPAGVENERVLAFLESLESGNEIALYECGSAVPHWCERCLRQADRILAVARVDRPDHFEEVRAMVGRIISRRQPPQLEVALVHPEGTDVPKSGARSLAWLPASARIHHLRMGDERDYERLARTLVRSGVALVLSGGGARGIAHIGVLKALEDAHVPVDAIAGASMGSIFAAGYARGWDADTLMDRVRVLFRHRMALYDPTLPRRALLRGRKLERVLRSYFEGLDIENLWLPFFCVSTNLARAEMQIHDRGDLWRAVAASCSIPGIFPPRCDGKDRLVDGSVMNNLPIDVMATRFQGAVIASDVSATRSGPAPRRARGWFRRRRELVDRGPGILETLTHSSMVGSQHATLASLARGEASLHLRLPVGRFGMLDWDAHEDLFAAGYEFAREQLSSWEPPPRRDAASGEILASALMDTSEHAVDARAGME